MNTTNAINAIRSLVKGTTIVSVESETTPKMLKTNNPFINKNVVKVQTMNGIIGFDYENSVNRLATKEGKEEREAKARTWGTLSSDRLFVEHKGEHYLQMKVEKSNNIKYLVDGVEVPKEVLAPFLPKSSKSSTQSDLVGEVVVRDVKMSNIKAIKIKGMTIS